MKRPSNNSNLLAFNAQAVIDSASDWLDADENCALLVISSSTLTDAAKTAIENSADKLGFDRRGCGWLVLPDEKAGGDETISPKTLWRMIEGLDPRALVITDSTACAAVSSAYDQSLKIGDLNRVACRSVCAFANFSGMLSQKEDKQTAWALLKRLR